MTVKKNKDFVRFNYYKENTKYYFQIVKGKYEQVLDKIIIFN